MEKITYGNDTYSFDFTEVIKPFETAITMPEFTVKFDNSSKKFDIINPLGLMAFLRKKMKVTTQIGVKTSAGYEYVSTGDFYLYGWPDDSQEDAASLTCRPSMAFATQYYVAPGTGTQTVADAAAIIFANVSEAYTIETELQSVVVNQYIGDNITLLSAMGQLAVACCGYWQIGRDGTYNLKKWQYAAPTNSIDYDNAWEKPKINQKELVTSVNVKYYSWDGIKEMLKDYDNIVSMADNSGEMVEIQSSFIPTKAQADIVAAAALNFYSLRLKFEESYRGDMSIETGDNVTLETDYDDSEVMILEHNLTWDESGLDGTIKGLGAV